MLRMKGALVAAGLGLGLVLGLAGTAGAQPIQSPQDQACREEATRRVFSDNPRNLDPYVRGRQIWTACMARSKVGAKPASRARGKRARRR